MHLISLHGELDISRKASIEEDLSPIRRFGPNSVTVLDLTDVSYADSNLVHALIKVGKSLKDQLSASSLCIVATKQIRRLLHVTGLDLMFPVFDDVASAQRHVLAMLRHVIERKQGEPSSTVTGSVYGPERA